MEDVNAHESFFLRNCLFIPKTARYSKTVKNIKNCLFIPKLLYTLRTAPTFERSDIPTLFDEAIRSTLQTVPNVPLDEQTWQQLTLPVKCARMGIHKVTELSTPAFLSSVSKSRALVESIIKTGLPETDLREAADSDDQKKQKKWYQPIAENLPGSSKTSPLIKTMSGCKEQNAEDPVTASTLSHYPR